MEPDQNLSMGRDLWNVRLKDPFGSITEDAALANGGLHDDLFAVIPDPIGRATPTA